MKIGSFRRLTQAGFIVAALFRSVVGVHAELSPASPPASLPAAEGVIVTTPTNQPVMLDKLSVTAKQQALFNEIDRKVYSVGQEILSTSGSASDLLQNIPSVQVDVDGNVSLRGNENVLILVDGKSSTLMSSKNRADALAQLPADSIDAIEIITNPSAKYKSEGAAGIINITLKHRHQNGLSGGFRGSLGNDRRGSSGLSGSYHGPTYTVSASINLRQDDRLRTMEESRRHFDPASNSFVSNSQKTIEHMRPLSRFGELGVEISPSTDNVLGLSASYNDRRFFRSSTMDNLARGADNSAIGDYARKRADHEWQTTAGVTGTWDHHFAEKDRELKMELKREHHQEQEDNRYENLYRIPLNAPSADFTLIRPLETKTQFSADYIHPFADGPRLETGYAGEANGSDADFREGTFDSQSGLPVVDPTRTNRFRYHDAIHALYATYQRTFGPWGMLAGLRAEETRIETDQVTLQTSSRDSYGRLHPSMHLRYELTEANQLQLNYSHRIRRPEAEDMNPFPEYQDPFNLRAGNPHLRPEETHSLEMGYQHHRDETSCLATIYYRQTHDAFTPVTRYIDASTLLTTQENLASNRSGGLELALTKDLGSRASFNISANAFYSQIDASNLGYASNRSTVAWDAKLNADFRITRSNLLQFNTNYRAKRLTAQGYRLPSFIANVGFRHELKGRNLALTVVVSDLFDTFKERTLIDTPTLHDELSRRRNSRTIYAGFVYNFGQGGKKAKPDALKVDDTL